MPPESYEYSPGGTEGGCRVSPNLGAFWYDLIFCLCWMSSQVPMRSQASLYPEAQSSWSSL